MSARQALEEKSNILIIKHDNNLTWSRNNSNVLLTLHISLYDLKLDFPIGRIGIIFVNGFHYINSLHWFMKLCYQDARLWELLKHWFLIIDIYYVNKDLLESIPAFPTHVPILVVVPCLNDQHVGRLLLSVQMIGNIQNTSGGMNLELPVRGDTIQKVGDLTIVSRVFVLRFNSCHFCT